MRLFFTPIAAFLAIAGQHPLSAQEQASNFSNLPKVLNLAEQAYRKGDLQTAEKAYREALSLGGKNAPDSRSYFERKLRLAVICYKLGDIKSSQLHLRELLEDKELPQDLFLRSQLVRARSFSEEKLPGKAYRTLSKTLEKVPLELWEKKDQAYFTSLQYMLDEYYSDLLAKAERHSISGLYDESYPLFKRVWVDTLKGYFPKASVVGGQQLKDRIRYLLAESAYHLKKIDIALRILKHPLEEIIQDPTHANAVELNILYLGALCHKEQGYLEDANLALETYLVAAASQGNTDQYQQVLWELGLNYYQTEQDHSASKYLYELQEVTQDSKLKNLSLLYLAKIEIRNQFYQEAYAKLGYLSKNLPIGDVLQFEVSYLRGEIAYKQGNYVDALAAFDQAVSAESFKKAPWHNAVTLRRAQSYLQLAYKELDPSKKLISYLQAEQVLKALIEEKDFSAKATIELAKAYLRHAHDLQDVTYYEKVEELLITPSLAMDAEQKAEAILLRVEASDSFEAREALFRQLQTDKAFFDTFGRKKSFLYRAMNAMEAAEKKDPADAIALWEQANTTLNQALHELNTANLDFYALALKLKAEALYHLGGSSHLAAAQETLDQLFNEKVNFISALEDTGEAYYLRGIISAELYRLKGFENDLHTAKTMLELVSQKYQGHSYTPHALYTLGALQFQTKEYEAAYATYSDFLERYPQSSYEDQVLFWISEAAWKKDLGDKIVRSYRSQLFDRFPESPLAPLAYLNYYSFEEYIHGGDAELTHLQKMQELFPKSPFLIVSEYLQGLYEKKEFFSQGDQKHLTEALSFFQACTRNYTHFSQTHAIPSDYFTYLTTIHFQAQLEEAISYALQNEGSQGEQKSYKVLTNIVQNFQNEQNITTQALLKENPYPKILEEAEFALSQLYLKQGQEIEARKVISQMIEKYQSLGLKKGYYLSRCLFELGNLNLSASKWEPALYYFNKSEEAQDILSPENKLELWLKKSICLRGIGELDEALKTLTLVINTEFPTKLIGQALYLKAEIYEELGKKDLAKKNLKAAAKHSGESALKAQAKLREYGT